MASNHLALLANLLDTGTDFHCVVLGTREPDCGRNIGRMHLLVSIGDAASSEVIRRQLHLNTIAGQDADVVHPHLSRYVGEHLVTIVQLDPEHRIWKGFGDLSFQDDRIFFGLRQCETSSRNRADGRGSPRAVKPLQGKERA